MLITSYESSAKTISSILSNSVLGFYSFTPRELPRVPPTNRPSSCSGASSIPSSLLRRRVNSAERWIQFRTRYSSCSRSSPARVCLGGPAELMG